jgi:hypothetical protein
MTNLFRLEDLGETGSPLSRRRPRCARSRRAHERSEGSSSVPLVSTPAARSWSFAASMSETTRWRNWLDPGTDGVRLVPNITEVAEPGGVT